MDGYGSDWKWSIMIYKTGGVSYLRKLTGGPLSLHNLKFLEFERFKKVRIIGMIDFGEGERFVVINQIKIVVECC